MRFQAALVLVALAAGPALGGESAMGIFAGKHNGYDRFGANLRLAPSWSQDWGSWRASLQPEFELSRFRRTERAQGPDSLDVGGALGVLRLVYGQGSVRPYAELGLGGALLSRTRLGPKELSTTFQFTEQVGVGLEFGGRFGAGWRYAHYSNGDLAKPNAGLDVNQLVLTTKF